MSRKFYLLSISITLGIAAVFILFLFFFFEKKSQTTTENKNTSQTKQNYELLPIEELEKKDNLQIETGKGTVIISNVYKNPVEKLSKNGVSFKSDDNYSFDYYPQDNGFLIVITNPNVLESEINAEADFIKKLNITKEDACKLKVSITVPFSVSEKYSGGVYGFSFCPDVDHIK